MSYVSANLACQPTPGNRRSRFLSLLTRRGCTFRSALYAMRTILCLVLLSSFTGCSPKTSFGIPDGYAHHSGDFTPFLSAAIVKNGGKAAGTIPRFDAEWWSKSDTNGFQIIMATNYQTGVEACMRQLYGEPVVSTGFPRLLYRSTNVGVTISAQTQLDPIHIIVTRAGVIHDERLPIGDK